MNMPQMTKPAVATKPRRRWIVAGVLGVLLCIALTASLLIWKSRSPRPPSTDDDPVAIAKYTSTPEFAQLSMEQKEQYLRRLRDNMPALVAAARAGKLTREEAISATRNGIKAGARIEMAHYFDLPPGPDRQAHLDKLIDEQEQMRAYARQNSQNPDNPNRGALPFNSGVELKQFMESLEPSERVKMAQFGFDLFQRRIARGLNPWPYGNGAK